MPSILVIILTWNKRRLTRQTVKSFLKFNSENIKKYDFLFIDNASTDTTVKWIKRHNFEVLENKKNTGVFRASTRAWKVAYDRKYDYILNLQNDFPSSATIPIDDIMLLFETRAKIGFVQLNDKKHVWMDRGGKLKMKSKKHNKPNVVAGKRIRGKRVRCGNTKFFISNSHFSFNPLIFPASLVPHLIKTKKPRERGVMEQFEKTGLRAAKVRKRCFETIIRKRGNVNWKR